MSSFILRVATRMLVGVILVFSVYLFFRGHNAPGGGFSGALVAGTGLSLFAITEGAAKVRRALRFDPLLLVSAGLLLALGAAMFAVLDGRPLLTGLWWPLRAAGEKPFIGTPLLFDAGVFLVVFGTVLALLLRLEEE